MSLQYYVLDSETNGLKCGFHELTEICCIRVQDRMQLARNIIAKYPERSSLQALQITGKTMADLQCGHPQHQVVMDFNKFFESDGLTPDHRCIIAHNALFDRKFLHNLWSQNNIRFPAALWVDTIPIVRTIFKNEGMVKPKTNLTDTCNNLGIKKVAGTHNAVSDARNLYFVWEKVKERVDHLEYIKPYPHLLSSDTTTDQSEEIDHE